MGESKIKNCDDLADDGKKLWKLIQSDLLFTNGQPIMLPPAPFQKHVDSYREEELVKVKRKKTFNQNRMDYDAECIVYRALENLDQLGIIVLHDLQYLKKQCEEIMVEKPTEGQHDFVVLVPGHAVIIIEVKRPAEDTVKCFERSWNSAGTQIMRFTRLLKGLCTRIEEEELRILNFRAFPLLDRESASKKADNPSLLCKQDFKDFPMWWETNVSSQIRKSVESSVHDSLTQLDCCFLKQEHVLMGLWVVNYRGHLSSVQSKLSRNLVASTHYYVDNMLTSQKIYHNPQNRPDNLVKLCHLDHSYLTKSKHFSHIKYLTQDQNRLLSAGPHVLVNGPAGSGKTLIMYARILKLLSDMRGQEEQILILVPWRGAAEELKKLVEESDYSISVQTVDLVTKIREQKCDRDLFDNMLETLKEFKMIIFVKPNFLLNISIQTKKYNHDKLRHIHERFIDMLKDTRKHIFCDDFHNSIAHYIKYCKTHLGQFTKPLSEILDNSLPLAHSILSLLNTPCASQRIIWVGCDMIQIVQYGFWGEELNKEVPKHVLGLIGELQDQYTHVVLLTGNLRNTYSIAVLLKELRGKFLETIEKFCGEDLKQILPNQEFQHFHRGITPRLYCVQGTGSFERGAEVARKELKMMFRSLSVCFNCNENEACTCTPPNTIKKEMALIPVYHNGCHEADLKDPGGGLSAFLDFRRRVKSIAKEFKINETGCNIFTDNVKYANSMEFPFVILMVDMSYCEPEESHGEELLLNLLAHLYAGVSRARVCCSIVLMSSNETPSKWFSQVCDILREHVKTVNVSPQLVVKEN